MQGILVVMSHVVLLGTLADFDLHFGIKLQSAIISA